jgi:hypothetical protein
VRCGSDVVGTITRLEGGDEQMRGHFARGPAYEKYGHLLAASDRAEQEQAGIHVFSAEHDMRIDDEGTLVVLGDEAHFKPAAAFIVLRSGGLG